MKIIFDLDGTLIDVSDRHYAVYREVSDELRGIALEKQAYWDLKKENAQWPKLLEYSKIPQANLADFMNLFIGKIEQPKYLKKDKLFPATKKVLSSLSNHELYLLSLRRSAQTLLDELESLGIKDSFKKVLSDHTDKAGFELKVDLIKSIAPSSLDVVVGDTEADILMAKKLGLTSIAVSSGIRSRNFLANLDPDYIITGVEKLPQLMVDYPTKTESS